MSREIKFRMWNKALQVMVVKSVAFLSVPFFADEDHGIYMQFTGLLDRNGKEIYEGDVLIADVNCLSDMGRQGVEVVWWNSGFCTRKIGTTFEPVPLHICVVGFRPEIIGNIYENPELLEVQRGC